MTDVNDMNYEFVAKSLDEVQNMLKASATKEDIRSLGEKQKELANQLLDLQQKTEKYKGNVNLKQETIGETFVKSEGFKNFIQTGQSFRMEFKEDTTPMATTTNAPGVIQPYVRPGILLGADRPLTVESIFPEITIATNAYTWTQEKSSTNNAGFVAEGAQAPTSAMTFEQKTGSIYTASHTMKVTLDMLEDMPACASVINARLVYGVDLKVEDAIVNGAGGAGQISGFMHEGNYVPHGATLTTPGLGGADATLFDLLRFSRAKGAMNGYTPNLFIVNPMDWCTMMGLKDKMGRTLVDSLAATGLIRPYGMQVLESQAMTQGKFAVLDPFQAATKYKRAGVTVEVAYTNADDFEHRRVTFLCYRRVGFSVDRVNAIIGGDLAIASA